MTLFSRGGVPGLTFPKHNLDVTYPSTGVVEFMLEAKAVGTPKHPGSPKEKPIGRAGSADLEKRIKEIGFKTIDLKAEYARIMAARGESPTAIAGDLTIWLRSVRPRCYVFIAARVNSDNDFDRVLRLANVAGLVRRDRCVLLLTAITGIADALHRSSGSASHRTRAGPVSGLPRLDRSSRYSSDRAANAESRSIGRRPFQRKLTRSSSARFRLRHALREVLSFVTDLITEHSRPRQPGEFDALKGFVPTPSPVVDVMVDKLFGHLAPQPKSTILDPGCGTGAFIGGLVRWCSRRGIQVPRIVGIESDPRHLPLARRNYGHLSAVSILHEDFLAPRADTFDYIIGNPPYVPITGLSEAERDDFRKRFISASGRFDLYLLFFEQALRLLKPGGRLVFITPEKFLYVRTAAPLRRALAKIHLEEIHLLDESTFEGLVTYPTITTVVKAPAGKKSRIIARDGTTREARLSIDGSSWLPALNGSACGQPGMRLVDACLRISCGVATGADSVYVVRKSELGHELSSFAHPTIAGREIRSGRDLVLANSMLMPYEESGDLFAEERLGELGAYLRQPERYRALMGRTCVTQRPKKPWYAFHENPPLPDILQPKILCKDITDRPFFLIDQGGTIVPRHSVYYLVPNDQSRIGELCDYLNSPSAQDWLNANCQRAANGFIRLQSHVLKQMPVPIDLVEAPQFPWEDKASVGAHAEEAIGR